MLVSLFSQTQVKSTIIMNLFVTYISKLRVQLIALIESIWLAYVHDSDSTAGSDIRLRGVLPSRQNTRLTLSKLSI